MGHRYFVFIVPILIRFNKRQNTGNTQKNGAVSNVNKNVFFTLHGQT
jgi:hypothetical protein